MSVDKGSVSKGHVDIELQQQAVFQYTPPKKHSAFRERIPSLKTYVGKKMVTNSKNCDSIPLSSGEVHEVPFGKLKMSCEIGALARSDLDQADYKKLKQCELLEQLSDVSIVSEDAEQELTRLCPQIVQCSKSTESSLARMFSTTKDLPRAQECLVNMCFALDGMNVEKVKKICLAGGMNEKKLDKFLEEKQPQAMAELKQAREDEADRAREALNERYSRY